MDPTPTTLGELFRSLDLSLTVRAATTGDEPDAWSCTLTRPDGLTYEIESVAFFDVDPDTGEEWTVDPSPSRVLSVLAGGDIESVDGEDSGDAEAEAEAAARNFLGDAAYLLLNELDAAALD